jgi:hypothetical protein
VGLQYYGRLLALTGNIRPGVEVMAEAHFSLLRKTAITTVKCFIVQAPGNTNREGGSVHLTYSLR